MLRKLLKYDFKEMGGLLLPILGALLVISFAGKLSLETKLFDALPDVFQVLAVTAYVIIIIACCVGAPIYFVIFFYKNLYSSRGYIMHTLPVTTNQKLFSKVITSFVLEMLTFLVCIISVMIILYDKNSFEEFFNILISGDTQFKAMFGMNVSTFLIVTIVLMMVSMFAQLLMFYASVSIGQIFQNHRVLGIIAGYMILNFANQIVSTALMMLLGATEMMYDTAPTGESIIAVYGISGCLCLLQAAVFYIICYYFMEKKLNLN